MSPKQVNAMMKRDKRMTKSLIAGLLFLGSCTTAAAQQTLNIHTTTQGVVSIAFSEQPQMSFATKDVLTVTTTSMGIDFPFAEVEKITFEDATDGIEALTVNDGSGQLLIYDLSGKLVRQGTASESGATVNLSTLRSGVYVVKDGKRTYKITKR